MLQPRLGPKPFTALNFNKVFTVPAAPNSDTNGTHESTTPVSAEPPKFITDNIVAAPDLPTPKSPTSDLDVPLKGDDYKNGKSDSSSQDEEVTSSDSGYKPKTPSTAERRKLFEVRSNSKEKEKENEATDADNVDTTDDKASGNFERSSVQRNSIAERRKIYERSQSVQEPSSVTEKPENKSPVMLRRKDSLKNRNNKSVEDIIKEEPQETRPKKTMPRQQSHDPQANRKIEPVVAAPVPKRTSTVFGKYS